MSRTCPRCRIEKPLSDFGVCRSRKDGLNLYCIFCIREKVRAFKVAKKEYVQKVVRPSTLRRMEVKRKPIIPLPIWVLGLKPKEAVLKALRNGAKTQAEIKRHTRLDPCDICDALAELWDSNQLNRAALRNRVYRLRVA